MLCGAVWGCAGVRESTGASCQRNDKTDTGKFSECGRRNVLTRMSENVSLAECGDMNCHWHERRHTSCCTGKGGEEVGRGMRRRSEIYVARNEKMEIRIYRWWWLSTKEERLTRK